MPTSDRYIHINFSDGTSGSNRVSAASNTLSPCAIDFIALASGDNTIIQPYGTVNALTICPPSTNVDTDDTDVVNLILKGDAADVGIPLHPTDPSSIALGTTPTIIIHADGILAGVKLIWT